MIKKLILFFSMDYDRKIEIISRITGINFLPSSTNSFFRNVYNFIILKNIYKFNCITLKKNNNFANLTKNILIINVRSGSTYLTKVLNEYITAINFRPEDDYKLRYVFPNNFYKLDRNFFLNNIDKNKLSNFIFSSRYPFGRKSAFFNLEKQKFVLVLRHPSSWIRSYFLYNYFYKDKNLINNIYQKYPIINNIVNKNLKYLKLINKVSSDKTLVIKYEDIMNEQFNEIKKIINYFNLILNKKILIDILNQNEKKNLEKQMFYNNRISPELDKNLNNFIREKIEENINYIKIKKIYNNIINK